VGTDVLGLEYIEGGALMRPRGPGNGGGDDDDDGDDDEYVENAGRNRTGCP